MIPHFLFIIITAQNMNVFCLGDNQTSDDSQVPFFTTKYSPHSPCSLSTSLK
jgi:hypothetical protein